MARSVASTTTYKVWQGINLLNASNQFIVVGQTSDWVAEPTPDTADPTDTSPAEPVVAIRPYLTTMAVEVSAEEYALLDPSVRNILTISGVPVYFAYVAEEDAYTMGANYLIAIAEYNPAVGHPEPTTDGFRSYYFCTELEPSAGHESDDWLAPGHIEGYGKLMYINNGPEIPITGGGFSVDLIALMELR